MSWLRPVIVLVAQPASRDAARTRLRIFPPESRGILPQQHELRGGALLGEDDRVLLVAVAERLGLLARHVEDEHAALGAPCAGRVAPLALEEDVVAPLQEVLERMERD